MSRNTIHLLGPDGQIYCRGLTLVDLAHPEARSVLDSAGNVRVTIYPEDTTCENCSLGHARSEVPGYVTLAEKGWIS
jgi:hypothetical protein